MWPFEITRTVLKVCIAGREEVEIADRENQIRNAAEAVVDILWLRRPGPRTRTASW
jgi:hypothetical protein